VPSVALHITNGEMPENFQAMKSDAIGQYYHLF